MGQVGGVAELCLQSVYEGCISVQDMEVERRPYHRNCGCALHRQGWCSQKGKKVVSYPIKRSSSNGCLSISSSKKHRLEYCYVNDSEQRLNWD
ncbi:hypothetical protein Syun_004061 [Stephania yunnanensis]|uniref:Uncharacterized protein n=1 Tax=Stephania yunnanensis TaxID=152371 RepID=A0AAP0L5M3_9MAGN